MAEVKAGSLMVLMDEDGLRSIVQNAVLAALKEYGVTGNVNSAAKQVEEGELMATRVVKKNLKEKGYRVTSDSALRRVLKEEYKLVPVKKGSDNWWRAEDVNRIPAKK